MLLKNFQTKIDHGAHLSSFSKEFGYQIKKIVVKPGSQLSLQRHKFRSEHWVVVDGTAEVIGRKKFYFK